MDRDKELRIRAYVRLVRSADAVHADLSRSLLSEGLTASQFGTLKALRMHGDLAQRDIAKHILKTGGNITMVVDNLERAGLVARNRDTQDRRLVYVSLTDKGRALFDRIYPHHLDRIQAAMGVLSVDECETLDRLLDKLCHQAVVVGGARPESCLQVSDMGD